MLLSASFAVDSIALRSAHRQKCWRSVSSGLTRSSSSACISGSICSASHAASSSPAAATKYANTAARNDEPYIVSASMIEATSSLQCHALNSWPRPIHGLAMPTIGSLIMLSAVGVSFSYAQ